MQPPNKTSLLALLSSSFRSFLDHISLPPLCQRCHQKKTNPIPPPTPPSLSPVERSTKLFVISHTQHRKERQGRALSPALVFGYAQVIKSPSPHIPQRALVSPSSRTIKKLIAMPLACYHPPLTTRDRKGVSSVK